jgi:hypothetical protein
MTVPQIYGGMHHDAIIIDITSDCPARGTAEALSLVLLTDPVGLNKHPLGQAACRVHVCCCCVLVASLSCIIKRPFWHDSPGFMNESIMGIDSLLQFGGSQQPFGFRHGAFAMHPLRLNGVERGAFRRQPIPDDAHAPSRLFDLLIVDQEHSARSRSRASATVWAPCSPLNLPVNFFSRVTPVHSICSSLRARLLS